MERQRQRRQRAATATATENSDGSGDRERWRWGTAVTWEGRLWVVDRLPQNLCLLADNPPPAGASPLPPLPPQATIAHEIHQGSTEIPPADLFGTACTVDPFPAEVLHMLDNGTRHSRRISLAECSREGNP